MAPSSSTDTGDIDALLDDPKSVPRLRVLRSARHLIAERGLGVSMEEIADAAGVGRRTLFRHFDSRDALIAEAVASALDWYDRRVDEAVHDEAPLETWLAGLVTRIHDYHRASGRGLWQMAASDDDDLSPEMAAVNRRRRKERQSTTEAIAAEAWQRAGGRGDTPAVITNACALTISSFTTHSMLDYDVDTETLAFTTARLLSSLLSAEVAKAGQPRQARRTQS